MDIMPVSIGFHFVDKLEGNFIEPTLSPNTFYYVKGHKLAKAFGKCRPHLVVHGSISPPYR